MVLLLLFFTWVQKLDKYILIVLQCTLLWPAVTNKTIT